MDLRYINIINFPLYIASSRTYSFIPDYIRPLFEVGLLLNYPSDPREWSPKPGFSGPIRQLSDAGPLRTVRLLSEAGVLPDCSVTIQFWDSPGLSEWSPKPGCSRTIRLLPEVGLSLSPETAQGLSTKARTYLYDNYNNNVRKDKPSPHTHSWLQYIVWHTVNTLYHYLSSYWRRSVPDQIREHTDFVRPNSSGATVNGASNHWRHSRSLQVTFYLPGLYTTLDKLLRYTINIMRSVIRYTCKSPQGSMFFVSVLVLVLHVCQGQY